MKGDFHVRICAGEAKIIETNVIERKKVSIRLAEPMASINGGYRVIFINDGIFGAIWSVRD